MVLGSKTKNLIFLIGLYKVTNPIFSYAYTNYLRYLKSDSVGEANYQRL